MRTTAICKITFSLSRISSAPTAGEGLGAVAGLEDEGPPVGDPGERAGQVAGLPGEHERGEPGEAAGRAGQRGPVRPLRHAGRRDAPASSLAANQKLPSLRWHLRGRPCPSLSTVPPERTPSGGTP